MGESGSLFVQNTTAGGNSLIINTATKQATFEGSVDVDGDLDVDGHTNLDNVSIAGVTTMTGNLTINSTSNARAIILPDNKRIYFGDGEDFWIGSNGTNGEVSGSLWLYNHLYLYDNVRLRIGHGQDLELFHNGTDSYIDNNTGNLHLDSASNIIFETGSSTERLRITSNGKVNIGTGELDQTDRMLNIYGGRARISGITAGNSFEIYASNTSGQSYGILCQAGTGSSDINTALRNTSGVSLFRVRGDGVVFVGSSTVQQGSTSKLEVMGTLNNSYPGYSYPIMVSDDAAYNSSAGPGGGIGFSFKQNSGGAYAQAGGIRGIKENTTDGNYASALTFYTRPNGSGTTERLRISSDGYITAPNNVAFSARGGPADVTNNVIIFATIVFQRGGTNYSTSTGIFTAPVDGIYHFMCNPYRYTDSNDSSLNLQVSTDGGSNWSTQIEIRNMNNYNPGSGADSGRGWFTLSLSNLIDLNKDDQVRIKAINRVHCNGTFSRFSGFLVA